MVNGLRLVGIFLGKKTQIMARIGSIDGIPLFTTIQEALAWGASNGLSGYHMHSYGYMGGANHSQARGSNNSRPSPNPPTPSTPDTNSGGGY